MSCVSHEVRSYIGPLECFLTNVCFSGVASPLLADLSFCKERTIGDLSFLCLIFIMYIVLIYVVIR